MPEKSKTSLITIEACEALKGYGINARIVLPEPIKNFTKTDWNDVLIHQGKESVQVQISEIKTVNKVDLLDIRNPINTDKSLAHCEPNKSEPLTKNDSTYNKVFDKSLQRLKEMEMEL